MKRYLFPVAVLVVALALAAPAAARESVLVTPAAGGAPSEPAGVTDHQLVIRAPGLRVLTDMPIAGAAANTVIGARYWFTDRFGVDVGLGLGIIKNPNVDTQFLLALAVGIPIKLSDFKHVTFYIEPGLDFSLSHLGQDNTPFRFDFNAQFVAETSLGWLGIPRLAILTGFGIKLAIEKDPGGTAIGFGTAQGAANALFVNVGLLYYF